MNLILQFQSYQLMANFVWTVRSEAPPATFLPHTVIILKQVLYILSSQL